MGATITREGKSGNTIKIKYLVKKRVEGRIQYRYIEK